MVGKRISVLVLVSLFSVVLGGYSRSAGADLVFGPKEFLRKKGPPKVYHETFQAEEGAGKLIIKNGRENGRHNGGHDDDGHYGGHHGGHHGGNRVTSARIYLNGDLIAGPDDFKQYVYQLEFPVVLKQTNDLKIELFGQPGAFLVVEITQTSSGLPPVFATLADQEVREGQALTFTVQAEDPDNDPLTYSAANIPPGAVFDPLTQTFAWTPQIGQAGVYYPAFTVTDGVLMADLTVKITVTANPPTVSLTADPAAIVAGETATLSWTSAYAQEAALEPGFGPVDLNGTATVWPSQTTTYTLIATGSGLTSTAEVTITVHVINPIALQITSPLDGADLSDQACMVKGMVTNAGNIETGVTVNGIIALMDGDVFVANHVPLMDGENTLSVVARDAAGNSKTEAITVYADTAGDYILLTAEPSSGPAPFETTLEIDSSFDFTASDITYTGPDTVTFLENSAEQYRVLITTEGLYTFTAAVTDELGDTYTNSLVVVALDTAALDGLLRSKWEGMRAALIGNNILEALRFHHDDAQERYAAIYNALGDNLPMLAQNMRPVSPVVIEGLRAKYRTTQDHQRDGQAVTITYYVYFSQDQNGLWKIEMY